MQDVVDSARKVVRTGILGRIWWFLLVSFISSVSSVWRFWAFGNARDCKHQRGCKHFTFYEFPSFWCLRSDKDRHKGKGRHKACLFNLLIETIPTTESIQCEDVSICAKLKWCQKLRSFGCFCLWNGHSRGGYQIEDCNEARWWWVSLRRSCLISSHQIA